MGRSRVVCISEVPPAPLHWGSTFLLQGQPSPAAQRWNGHRYNEAKANTQDPVGAVINRPKCPIIDLCVEWYNVGFRCVYAGQSTIDNIVPRGRLIIARLRRGGQLHRRLYCARSR